MFTQMILKTQVGSKNLKRVTHARCKVVVKGAENIPETTHNWFLASEQCLTASCFQFLSLSLTLFKALTSMITLKFYFTHSLVVCVVNNIFIPAKSVCIVVSLFQYSVLLNTKCVLVVILGLGRGWGMLKL